MKLKLRIPVYSLQLFAEGAGGTGGAADGGTAQGEGVTAAAAVPQKADKNPLASVRYGIQEEAPVAGVQETAEVPPDLNAEFEELIKGKYKSQYDARMQDTIQKRLRGSKETVDKYNALSPVLEHLAKKYGVDASDAAAIVKAWENDDAHYEEEAMEREMSVPTLKHIKQMERENLQLRQQVQERNADKLCSQWMEQAEKTRAVYPAFDMRTEMENPRFVDLLKSNIDVRTAYEVLHRDEIIPAAMQFAANTVQAGIARSIAANGARPSENGTGSGSAAVVKSDVSKLTKADRQEIARRVARGEKIRF